MPLIGTFTGIGLQPQAAAVVPISASSVRLVFSEPMSVNAALTLAANYVMTHAIGSLARTVLSVTTEPSATPSYVVLTLDGNMTAGVANYTITVNTAGPIDLVGNTVDPAHNAVTFDGFGLAPGQLNATATPNIIMKDGGTPIEITFISVLPDGNYRVHLGPLGTVADPICFSGVSGQGSLSALLALVVDVIAPPLPTGGPYAFTIVDAAGNLIGTTLALITVIPHDYKDGTFRLRRLFSPLFDSGARRLEGQGYPQ